MMIFILRPWEQLLPWLGDIHFERITALILIITIIISHKKQYRFSVQSLLILFFFLALGLSSIFAWDFELSKEPFSVYRNLVVFYFIIFFAIRSWYDLLFMLMSYIFTMTVYLAKAQWEFFIHGQHRFDMGVYRMVGIENTFGGPNNLAMSIVISLPIFLFIWSIRNDLCQDWPGFLKKWFPRILIVYFLLAISSIILTNSRSGMLGLILFILFSTLKGQGFFKKIGYIISGLFLLFIIWEFMPQESQNRFRTIWDPDSGPANAQQSAEGRFEGFHAGINMYKENPVTGVGIGNFTAYRRSKLDGVDLEAHNLIGQLLGETGTIGLLAFLFMIGTIFINVFLIKRYVKIYNNPRVVQQLNFAIAARNSLILLLFLGMFGHNLYRFNWLWLAAFCDLTLIFIKGEFSFNNNSKLEKNNAID